MPKKIFTSLVSLGLVVSVATPALARDGDHSDDNRSTNTLAAPKTETETHTTNESHSNLDQTGQKKVEVEQENEAKKEDKKKKICEARLNRIKVRDERIVERAKKHKDRLDVRLEKLQAFVAKKNLTVPNYDALVADVKAKREALIKAHVDLKAAAQSFNCDDHNRRGKVIDIKAKVAAFKTAANTYKTSLKTLLQAVRDAAKAAEVENKPSSSTNTTTGVR